MKHQYKDKMLYLYFDGDFDNVAVGKIKQEAVQLIELLEPTCVKLDFEEVQFIDSTGIGFVLARYKQLQKIKAELVICNLSPINKKIFTLSGIFQLIKLERNEVKV